MIDPDGENETHTHSSGRMKEKKTDQGCEIREGGNGHLLPDVSELVVGQRKKAKLAKCTKLPGNLAQLVHREVQSFQADHSFKISREIGSSKPQHRTDPVYRT